MNITEIITKYEQLSKETPGLGRIIALAISKQMSKEDIQTGFQYGVEKNDISIRNVFMTAAGFKRNGITE